MATDVKTPSGFECRVEEEALDDMELMEDLVAIDKGDLSVLPAMTLRLLGQEQKQRLYEHLRIKGRVPITAVANEIGNIIGALKSKKN